jgi:hypothetical protein
VYRPGSANGFVARSRGSLETWFLVAAVNVFFALFHPCLGVLASLPAIARSLVVNATLFLVPAAGWERLAGPPTRMLGMRLARVMGISTVAFFGLLGVVRVLGMELTHTLSWNVLWVIADIGCVTMLTRRCRVRRRSLLVRERIAGGLTFVLAYAFFFWGATRVVPPQEDHDLEVLATGYGLLTRFEPLMLTDRHDVYFFAHPPLLHFLVGGSFLLHGSLDELGHYDAASQRARALRNGQSFSAPSGVVRLANDKNTYRVDGIEGSNYQLVSAMTGAVTSVPVEKVELAGIYERYNSFPHLLQARTPNVFLGATTVALLALWGARISGRWWMGLVGAVAYATSPEVFVRSAYGGYFAIGAFSSVVILLAWERWIRWPAWSRAPLPVLTSTFAAVADHKLVFLPATLGLVTLVRTWSGGTSECWLRRVPVAAVGFALGTFLFWCWGFSVAPRSFVEDHFHNHLMDRVVHLNPLGYGGYPATGALWREFSAHTGYLLVPVSTLMLVVDLFRRRRGTPYKPSTGVWLTYVALMSGAFTLIDWRMTKHLVPLMVPLCLGLMPDRGAPRWRLAVPLMAGLVVAIVNVWFLAGLVQDFKAFTVTPAW